MKMSRVEKAAPILALLRKHESEGAAKSQGVPNAYCVVYGGIPKANRPKELLTTYTIAEIAEWQNFVVSKGAASSAAGAYQIIRKTLEGLGIPKSERRPWTSRTCWPGSGRACPSSATRGAPHGS
jgi:hypothetical protein